MPPSDRRVGAPVAAAVVHLPPPLHGLSRVSAVVVDELRRRAPGSVVVADISGASTTGLWGRLVRIPRVLAAAAVLLRHRRCGQLYLTCDGGSGVLYTAALLGLAGLLGYRTHLHHHSLAHIRPPRAFPARCLERAVRRHRASIVHVAACRTMAAEVEAHYGPGTEVFVLPLHCMAEPAVVLAEASPDTTPDGAPATGRLVLGHLGNLTISKGLGRVLEVLDAGIAAGLDLDLVVAGPAWEPDARALLDQRLAAAGTRVRWLGPVTGDDKRAFFDAIDVFVFPSRYEHESFAIVVAEAQAAGKPVLAYRAGCLDQAEFGEGVLTYAPEVDFVSAAVDQLRRWLADPTAFGRAGTAAAGQGSANRATSQERLDELVAGVLGAAG